MTNDETDGYQTRVQGNSMFEPEEDWRASGAKDSDLEGRRLHWRRWARPKPSWDHDHCAGCWATFMDEDRPDVLREGYTTGEDHPRGAGSAWVCPTCFSDLKPALGWTAASLDALDLDPETLRITKECLRAAVEGPFFPDWEFQTLMGVDRETARVVMDAWPARTVEPEPFVCAVVNSLTWLVLYPHGHEEALDRYVSVGPDEVRQALDRLRAAGL